MGFFFLGLQWVRFLHGAYELQEKEDESKVSHLALGSLVKAGKVQARARRNEARKVPLDGRQSGLNPEVVRKGWGFDSSTFLHALLAQRQRLVAQTHHSLSSNLRERTLNGRYLCKAVLDELAGVDGKSPTRTPIPTAEEIGLDPIQSRFESEGVHLRRDRLWRRHPVC